MNALEELRRAVAKKENLGACEKALRELPPDTQEAFNTAILRREISSRQLADILTRCTKTPVSRGSADNYMNKISRGVTA